MVRSSLECLCSGGWLLVVPSRWPLNHGRLETVSGQRLMRKTVHPAPRGAGWIPHSDCLKMGPVVGTRLPVLYEQQDTVDTSSNLVSLCLVVSIGGGVGSRAPGCKIYCGGLLITAHATQR